MQKKLLFAILFLLPLFVSAQYGNKVKKRNNNGFYDKKSRPQRQVVFGFGACNFLGELGGANQIGTHFVKDLEFSLTRPSAQLAYRYKANARAAVKVGLYYQLLKGDDKLTQEPYRKNRNLSFKSNLFELSVQGEFYFTKDQQGHLYRIKNAKGKKNYNFQGYVFGGVGLIYFNPKAQYQGRWYALQPLGTEGEGLEGGPKKYSRFSVCIPYGIGVCEGIGKSLTVGLELGMRYTFSDYIDDVSGDYFDNKQIAAANGPIAAHFADPSIAPYPVELGGGSSGATQTTAGQQRGDPAHKDAYMFLNVTLTYKLANRHRVKSKF